MDNRAVFDWNDLRYFLAVARGGSTLAAARMLGTSQSTVHRRLTELEKHIGCKQAPKKCPWRRECPPNTSQKALLNGLFLAASRVMVSMLGYVGARSTSQTALESRPLASRGLPVAW